MYICEYDDWGGRKRYEREELAGETERENDIFSQGFNNQAQ